MNLTRPLVLASSSPRRQQLLRDLGVAFAVRTKDTPEDFPSALAAADVPVYLAEKKARAFDGEHADAILLTADTVVILDDQILNKPTDAADAARMLALLSGRTHAVVTGVCVRTHEGFHTFADLARVTFRALTPTEIDFYITHHQPFDKAGAYGAQDWLGLAGITRIEGSYFTVMGLPTHLVYAALLPYRA